MIPKTFPAPPVAPVPDDVLLTVEDVAKMLGMSTAWVRHHATGFRRPVLPCYRFGRAIRFDRRDVQAWKEQMRRVA